MTDSSLPVSPPSKRLRTEDGSVRTAPPEVPPPVAEPRPTPAGTAPSAVPAAAASAHTAPADTGLDLLAAAAEHVTVAPRPQRPATAAATASAGVGAPPAGASPPDVGAAGDEDEGGRAAKLMQHPTRARTKRPFPPEQRRGGRGSPAPPAVALTPEKTRAPGAGPVGRPSAAVASRPTVTSGGSAPQGSALGPSLQAALKATAASPAGGRGTPPLPSTAPALPPPQLPPLSQPTLARAVPDGKSGDAAAPSPSTKSPKSQSVPPTAGAGPAAAPRAKAPAAAAAPAVAEPAASAAAKVSLAMRTLPTTGTPVLGAQAAFATPGAAADATASGAAAAAAPGSDGGAPPVAPPAAPAAVVADTALALAWAGAGWEDAVPAPVLPPLSSQEGRLAVEAGSAAGGAGAPPSWMDSVAAAATTAERWRNGTPPLPPLSGRAARHHAGGGSPGGNDSDGPSPAAAQPAPRRFSKASPKVSFDEGVRLADGRIYVPLPFIHENFADTAFPCVMLADIHVNQDCIKEGCQVKIARSQNKTRRHGLGNHWVTGHQRLIKHYKDVRLMGLELAHGRLKVRLNASGTWDEQRPLASSRHMGHLLGHGAGHFGGGHLLGAFLPGALGLLPGGGGAAGAGAGGGLAYPPTGLPAMPNFGAMLAWHQAADQHHNAMAAMQLQLQNTPGSMAALQSAQAFQTLSMAAATSAAATPGGVAGTVPPPTAAGAGGAHSLLGGEPYSNLLALLQPAPALNGTAGAPAVSHFAAAAAGGAASSAPGALPADSRSAAPLEHPLSGQRLPSAAQQATAALAAATAAVAAGNNSSNNSGGGGRAMPGAPADVGAWLPLAPVLPLTLGVAGQLIAQRSGGVPATDSPAAAAAAGGATPSSAVPSPAAAPAAQAGSLSGGAGTAVSALLSASSLGPFAGSTLLVPAAAAVSAGAPGGSLQAAGQAAFSAVLGGSAQPSVAAAAPPPAAPQGLMALPPVAPIGASEGAAPVSASAAAALLWRQLAVAAAAAAAPGGSAAGAAGAAAVVAAAAGATAAAAGTTPSAAGSLPTAPAAVHADGLGGGGGGGGGLPELMWQGLPSVWNPGPSGSGEGLAGGAAPTSQELVMSSGPAANGGLGAGGMQMPFAPPGSNPSLSLLSLLGVQPLMMDGQPRMNNNGAGGGGGASGSGGAAPAQYPQYDPTHVPSLAEFSAFSAAWAMAAHGGPGGGGMMMGGGQDDGDDYGGGGGGQYPRLYDGRIHVPLHLIQHHFADAEFPAQIVAQVVINQKVVGEELAARIVKYKKHKRPNHFNFWITGLQKTLARYNDLRQAGVSLDAATGNLRIKLLAAV